MQKAARLHLGGLDDGQQGLLNGSGHVRRIATHIEVRVGLQQPPHQDPALPQSVLHVHLVRLRCQKNTSATL